MGSKKALMVDETSSSLMRHGRDKKRHKKTLTSR